MLNEEQKQRAILGEEREPQKGDLRSTRMKTD